MDLAKLEAYGFGRNALKLLHLTGHKQRVLVNGTKITPKDTKTGVPQEPVLGHILFNALSMTFC